MVCRSGVHRRDCAPYGIAVGVEILFPKLRSRIFSFFRVRLLDSVPLVHGLGEYHADIHVVRWQGVGVDVGVDVDEAGVGVESGDVLGEDVEYTCADEQEDIELDAQNDHDAAPQRVVVVAVVVVVVAAVADRPHCTE